MFRERDPMTARGFAVSELFGPTIQGEGPTQGRAVMFLRLGLCNLDCRWCDTPYTWDWTGKNGTKYDRTVELVTMPAVDIAAQIIGEAGPVRRLVVTGGEPLIQQRHLAHLFALLPGFDIEIETNGTIAPDATIADRVQFNVSPKLANSGIAADRRIDYDTLGELARHRSTFKFVATDPADLDEIDMIVTRLDVEPSRVYVMPEGTDGDTIRTALPGIMDAAARCGWSVSPRLHVLAYNNLRGV